MVKAIRVHELGGPEVLKWEDVEIGEPQEGEIRVKNRAAGLNFIDTYFRTGAYKGPVLPYTPGIEGVGEVISVGPEVTDLRVGDVVAYGSSPNGSYAEELILPASVVVPVPASLDPVIVAAVLAKGMTARYLVCQCFKVEPGHTVLIHAAAGGTGSLLCQWANTLGATVIGTVSTEEKAVQAKSDGCHFVVNYKHEDFVSRVNEITFGKGVDAVYDSIGKDTFEYYYQRSSVSSAFIGVLEAPRIHGSLWPVIWATRSGSHFSNQCEIPLLDKTNPQALQHNARRAPRSCWGGIQKPCFWHPTSPGESQVFSVASCAGPRRP